MAKQSDLEKLREWVEGERQRWERNTDKIVGNSVWLRGHCDGRVKELTEVMGQINKMLKAKKRKERI